MSAETRILALIPAYNEAPRVAAVVRGALQHLPVLVVDDGSRDATANEAENAGAEVQRQVPNQGKGVALRTGFRAALENGYDYVLTLDADGQHDPAEIPAFLQTINGAPDLVIGARNFSQMPLVRRIGNTIGRGLFSWAMGARIEDNQSGYRLISRRLMEAVLSSSEQGFEFEVEMIMVCVRSGFKLAWVPIQTIYRERKSHIKPLHHAIHFFRVVFQTRQAMRSVK